ncbi:unnamed protein product [Dovyalis caffra]|uniref:Uncharacterized protein n=1 Tax=Dovyalis caffra TaxID=77055 RepID=A0AAV1S450_9ROSI|nr:unnamed protein product [Dovyalis caffra]
MAISKLFIASIFLSLLVLRLVEADQKIVVALAKLGVPYPPGQIFARGLAGHAAHDANADNARVQIFVRHQKIGLKQKNEDPSIERATLRNYKISLDPFPSWLIPDDSKGFSPPNVPDNSILILYSYTTFSPSSA